MHFTPESAFGQQAWHTLNGYCRGLKAFIELLMSTAGCVGDQFFVSWDPRLMPSMEVPPMQYTPKDPLLIPEDQVEHPTWLLKTRACLLLEALIVCLPVRPSAQGS